MHKYLHRHRFKGSTTHHRRMGRLKADRYYDKAFDIKDATCVLPA